MAGHSKWANIKRRKEAQDAKRGKIFTRLLREVTVAARMGGGDPDANPRLRSAVQDCKDNNVPNDNIERAVKKGTGDLEGQNYEEVTYEGYGPNGVAFFVEAVTDNRNRTVSEVRHVFTKHGGNLGEHGSVSYLFDQRGYFIFDPEKIGEEELMEHALELEVQDIATDKDVYEVFTEPTRYLEIKEALKERGLKPEVSELAQIPTTLADLEESDQGKVDRLYESLEELDDVQNVWANYESGNPALEEAEAG